MSAPRKVEERTFTTHDGVDLFYRYWPSVRDAAAPRAVVMFHRGHEHSGRMAHVVDEIDLPDFAFVRLPPASALLNGGFARAFHIRPEDL